MVSLSAIYFKFVSKADILTLNSQLSTLNFQLILMLNVRYRIIYSFFMTYILINVMKRGGIFEKSARRAGSHAWEIYC
jgi:hypothetical protein